MRSRSRIVTLSLGMPLVLAVLALRSGSAYGQAQAKPSGPGVTKGHDNGHYADVNGINIYYEIHGLGRPLILLHGGLGAIEMFGPNLPALAKGRQVIAVDLQGHGRTADIDRPLSVELMADDIAALITHLKLERPDVMGYSLGGGVALQTEIRHPELVGKLVVVSTPFRRNGFYPDILTQQAQVSAAAAEPMKQTPMYQLYSSIAPKPEDWPRLLGKIGDAMKKDFDFSNQVAGIKATTLIVAADADIFPPAHAVELFGLLGGGQRDPGWDGSGRPKSRLAILPGLTHYNIFSDPALAATVIPFLDEPAATVSDRSRPGNSRNGRYRGTGIPDLRRERYNLVRPPPAQSPAVQTRDHRQRHSCPNRRRHPPQAGRRRPTSLARHTPTWCGCLAGRSSWDPITTTPKNGPRTA
jgi:pimeloyl-ACP methyl ester carboxylesterase